VLLVKHNHVIELLASNGADPSLGDSVLPRAAVGGPLDCCKADGEAELLKLGLDLYKPGQRPAKY
jgi:hypothetical protein